MTIDRSHLTSVAYASVATLLVLAVIHASVYVWHVATADASSQEMNVEVQAPMQLIESSSSEAPEMQSTDFIEALTDQVDIDSGWTSTSLEEIADGRWYVVDSFEVNDDMLELRLHRDETRAVVKLPVDMMSVDVADLSTIPGVGAFAACDLTGFGIDWTLIVDERSQI